MSTHNNLPNTSATTQSLVELLLQRDQAGQRKYGTSLDRIDLLPEDWAKHAIEEALDMAGYLSRFASTVGELRAENLRLAEENVRMRAMLAPILELACTLDVEPAQKPAESIQVGLTARDIAEALGYHKDSVNNWKRKGLLPEPVAGTGEHPFNPARYVVDLEALRVAVEARQEAAKIGNAEKIAKKPIEISGPTITWDDAALALGISRDTVRLYIKRGLLVGGVGLATVESVKHYKANRLQPGQKKAKIVAEAPSPKDVEIETPEIIVEPRPAPQPSEATKHDYHWRNALPVLEAAIEKAEAEGEACIEVAYQSTPGAYQNRGAFVVRPFGQLGPGLTAFVRAAQESGKWSVTIPLRVESWIKPMAEGLVAYWRGRTIAASLPNPSSASATRSLQA